jgi:hypothetical protein
VRKKTPDWLGGSPISELLDGYYQLDQGEPSEYAMIRNLLETRAERLLFSLEMIEAWKSLDDAKALRGKQPNRPKFFWAAMNVELLINTTPEPSNSEIKTRYARIAELAAQLRTELRSFQEKIGFPIYEDATRMILARARMNAGEEPDEFDLTYAFFAQEIQYPHHGFNDGRFENALSVLAEASRIVSNHRLSRNRITKANSSNRLRNEIALAMSKAAQDYLGSYRDDIVATTVNAILDLVEDGEAITGDSVKKLRTTFQGKIFPPI